LHGGSMNLGFTLSTKSRIKFASNVSRETELADEFFQKPLHLHLHLLALNTSLTKRNIL